jgi:hypothetical protein
MMKDALVVEKGGYQDGWEEEKLLGFSYNFSFHVWAIYRLVESDRAS